MSDLKKLLEEAFNVGQKYGVSKGQWRYGGGVKPNFKGWYDELNRISNTYFLTDFDNLDSDNKRKYVLEIMELNNKDG